MWTRSRLLCTRSGRNRHTVLGLAHLPTQNRSVSDGRLFNGVSPYYSNCVFDLRPGADYSSMPDVALYLTYITRWLQKRKIVSGPATREEIEYGRRFLQSEMRSGMGIFADPPTSRFQVLPTKYMPPPDSDRPVWSMIVEDKELQERVRDTGEGYPMEYWIDDNCRLVSEETEDMFVKTNIRIPLPQSLHYPLSDSDLSYAVKHIYDVALNPPWRYLESLGWDGQWEPYSDDIEDTFRLLGLGTKPRVEERVAASIRHQVITESIPSDVDFDPGNQPIVQGTLSDGR